MNMKEIAKAITSIPATRLSDVKAALENDIEQASMLEYPDNILSPKEYGMKLMKRKKKNIITKS